MELHAWNVQGRLRRMSGQRYFVLCNARRIRDGEHPLRLPPKDEPCDPNAILKRVLITYPGGRIKIQVEFNGVPTARLSVWASRPLDRWVSRCYQCPRLGLLPPLVGNVADFTKLYVAKHGRPAPGQWFRVFLRQEQGIMPLRSGSVDVTVPDPAKAGEAGKKG